MKNILSHSLLIALVSVTILFLAFISSTVADPGSNQTDSNRSGTTFNITNITSNLTNTSNSSRQLFQYQNNEDRSHKDKRLYQSRKIVIDVPIVYPDNVRTASAREFLFLNRSIDAIWYYDESANEVHFFVEALGGLGEDFRLQPGFRYYVVVTKDINLTIP
jgi:hypothetical protein